MQKTGMLLHVYHLEVLGWEKLVWGDPAQDQLGTLTKFVDCLLDIPADEAVYSIVYSGPSKKDGMIEGEYTKHFLVQRIDEIEQFPRLQKKLERLSANERKVFVARIRGLKTGGQLRNTMDEVNEAAVYFTKQGVHKVLQIAAATHAPRCVRSQSVVRSKGVIPRDQQWFVIPSETCFNGADPADVVILEPPHRADDPLIGIHPSLPEVLQHYQYELVGDYRRDALLKISQVVADVLATQNEADKIATTA